MIGYLEHHIVDHCNLNCGGCSHFSPLAQPWFENLDDFVRDFTQLKELTGGYVGQIRLMGGEPLLHPQVTDFLVKARELFPYTQIQLVTNGILIPKIPDLAQICNEQKIVVCVSNYNLNMDLRKILADFLYTRVDWKGQLYNISLDTTGSLDPTAMFTHCDLHVHQWYYFQNGRFYHCCISANIHYFNEYFKDELPRPLEIDDYSIPIYNHTEQDIYDFLSIPIPLCKYCNTFLRERSYHNFAVTKKDIKEWIYQ